ncbi:unnamed protein product [Symbiodinium sp. CCMP2592]|nr:unnamed protein product [Symbiodinium sp. CCMP2592]
MPDDDKKEDGDINDWLNNFVDNDDTVSTAASSAPSKRRKATKIYFCVICKRSSEDNHWGQYDHRRDPFGDLCRRCMTVIFRIFPGEPVAEICIKYHDKGDNTNVKVMIDSGISVMEGAEPRLNPASSVQKETHQGWQISFKVAFLTESQITALCKGIPPEALNLKDLKKVSLNITDGTLCDGYLLSYVGLPQDVRDSAHEVQIFRSTGFEHQELYMPASNQLVPQQAANTWNFLTAADLRGRVQALKTPNTGSRLSAIQADANKVYEDRKKTEEAAAAVKQEPGEGGCISSEDENMDADERARRELHKSAAAEAPLEMTFLDEDATATTKAPKKRITKGKGTGKGSAGRGSGRSSSPPPPKKPRGTGSQSGGAKCTSVPLSELDLAKLPPNLSKIASRIGSVPDCFYKLDPLLCFVEPLGRSVDAAGQGGLGSEKASD